MLYHRGHVKPKAEPSADCWSWPTCRKGRRSRGRGPDNLTGRDWSLLGRHRLQRSKKKSVSHENNTTDLHCAWSLLSLPVCVCLCVWRAINMR